MNKIFCVKSSPAEQHRGSVPRQVPLLAVWRQAGRVPVPRDAQGAGLPAGDIPTGYMANTALSLILQVVRLAEIPDNVSPDLLRLGIQMNIPSVHSATEHTGEERFGRLDKLSRIPGFILFF